MIKDDIKTGNGKQIIQTAFKVIQAIQGYPKALQIQAVATVLLAIIEIIKIRPTDLLDSVARVLRKEENYSTTKGLLGYIKEELARE